MVAISQAKIEEAQEIRKLETRVWGEEVVNRYDIPMFVRFGYVFVAKEKNKIIGAICSYFTKDGELYVCDWVVDNKYQGRGVGINLYREFINNTKGKTLITFINSKNLRSLETHKKLGFQIAEEVDNPYRIKGNHLDKGVEFLVRLEN